MINFQGLVGSCYQYHHVNLGCGSGILRLGCLLALASCIPKNRFSVVYTAYLGAHQVGETRPGGGKDL